MPFAKEQSSFELRDNILYYVHSKDISGKKVYRQVILSKKKKEKQRKVIKQCHMINGTDGHFGVKKKSGQMLPFPGTKKRQRKPLMMWKIEK